MKGYSPQTSDEPAGPEGNRTGKRGDGDSSEKGFWKIGQHFGGDLENGFAHG